MTTTERPRRPLINDVLVYIPASLVPALVAAIVTLLLARRLLRSDYGAYNLILNSIMFTSALTSQWIQQSTLRYYSKDRSQRSDYEIKLITGMCCFLISPLYLVALCLVPFFSREYPSLIPCAFATAGLVGFNIQSSLLQALGARKLYSVFRIATSCAQLILIVLAILSPWPRLPGVLWATTLVWVGASAIMWHAVRMPSTGAILTGFRDRKNRAIIHRFVAYGIPMSGWLIASTWLNIGDRYLIGVFWGTSEVGLYAANYALATTSINLACMPILLAAHPLLMRAWDSGDESRTGTQLGTVIEWFALATLNVTVFFWLFSGDISRLLLGDRFVEGHFVIPIVGAATMLWQASMYLQKPLEFLNKTRIMFLSCLFASTLNFVLNFFLIPRYGWWVAAYTTLFTYTSYTLIIGIVGYGFLPWVVNLRLVIQNALLIVAAVAVPLGLRYMPITGLPGPRIALSFLLCVGLTIITMWRSTWALMRVHF